MTLLKTAAVVLALSLPLAAREAADPDAKERAESLAAFGGADRLAKERLFEERAGERLAIAGGDLFTPDLRGAKPAKTLADAAFLRPPP